MQRIERFLRHVLFLPIEKLKIFEEVKILSIRKNSGFLKMSSILQTSEAFHPEVFLTGDTLRVCGGFCAEHLWRCVISVLLPPSFGWIRRSEWCTAYFLSIFPLDCFWVTPSMKLLFPVIFSFACIILTLFMCFM